MFVTPAVYIFVSSENVIVIEPDGGVLCEKPALPLELWIFGDR